MSEPMTSHLQECIYCGEKIVPILNGHICDDRDWMQHTENLHGRIAALKAELGANKSALRLALERIAELERVAEAAVAYRGYYSELETHRKRERNLDQALREAGYLKEQG